MDIDFCLFCGTLTAQVPIRFDASQFLLWTALLLSLLALLKLNVWIYKNRHRGFLFTFRDYSALYCLREIPSIRGFKWRGPGRLEIRLNGVVLPVRSVKLNGVSAAEHGTGYPVLSLTAGYSDCVMEAESLLGDPVTISLHLLYRPGDGGPYCSLNAANVPVGVVPSYSIEQFSLVRGLFPQSEVDEAERILKSEVGIVSGATTREKVEQLGRFLIDRLYHNRLDDDAAWPPPEAGSLSPFQQYRYFREKPGLWCTHYADIYWFFANVAGIPTRLVSTGGQIDGINHHEHSFAESYLKEPGQWTVVDLSSRTLMVTQSPCRYGSGVELMFAHLRGRPESLIAHVYRDDRVDEVPLASHKPLHIFNGSPKSLLIYKLAQINRVSLASKINRYLFRPDAAFSLEPPWTDHRTKGAVLVVTLVLALFGGWAGVLGLGN